MSNTAQNLHAHSPSQSPALTAEQILAHPAENWTIVNSRGLRLDCDYRQTILLATINGQEVRLQQTDYDNSYGSDFRPNRIGSNGHHHWNSQHELFSSVASGIESRLSERAYDAAKEVVTLISESDPLVWERGPRAGYRGGQFHFGGYQRSFDHDGALTHHTEHDRCKEGYLGRIGFASILVREMNDGSVHGEVAVSQGDLHKTVRLPDTDTRKALEALRAHKIA